MSIREILQANGLELLKENVAEGGTATIHKAKVVNVNPPFDEEAEIIAIKQYKPSLLAIPGQKERIVQEAKLGASIRHPNFVKSYGIIHNTDDTILLAMDWVPGQQLATWNVDPSSPKDWLCIQSLSLELVSAVEALHKENVYHRDLKSENVIVSTYNHAKLKDLGIAEMVADDAVTMHTQVKDFIGSIRFASPQFVRGEQYQSEDDVYGLGTILFELTTGTRVYDEVERKTLLTSEILQRPPAFPGLLSGVPEPIQTLIVGMLYPNRARRPTLSEVRSTFEDPESSKYIKKELAAQDQERRGYDVIHVCDEDKGHSIYADLRGKKLNPSEDIYIVVRRLQPIEVPSQSSQVAPERWVSYVKLRHTTEQGIGHFVRVEKRKKNNQLTPQFYTADEYLNRKIGYEYRQRQVEYEYVDKISCNFQVGDIIVPEKL
jgi:serine/threonine protein kinase